MEQESFWTFVLGMRMHPLSFWTFEEWLHRHFILQGAVIGMTVLSSSLDDDRTLADIDQGANLNEFNVFTLIVYIYEPSELRVPEYI